jgi:outer membrane protein OmpA-like peptidoglycan-associated protein
MRYILTLFLCFSWLGLMAQHDLYNWQVKGYTGMANYYNPDKNLSSYLKQDHNLWHQLELVRSLGNTFGLSAGAAFGKIKGLGPQGRAFTTEARMSLARLYFYSDNGWLLKPASAISPYFFAGYGFGAFTMGKQDVSNHSKNRQVIPVGLGLKFRLTERWQLDLQTEAIYSTKSLANPSTFEQNKFNNGFLHTGLALAYNFGFKRSAFKAARFYASYPDTLSQGSAGGPGSGSLAKDAALPKPLGSPVAPLANPALGTIQEKGVVSSQYKWQPIGSLRSKRTAIQQSGTTYNTKGRAIVKERPLRHDTIWTIAGKATKEKPTGKNELDTEGRRGGSATSLETIGASEESRPAEVPEDVLSTNTDENTPGSLAYENDRDLLNQHIVLLLEKDRMDLEAANALNQQLRFTRDSLFRVMAHDTARIKQPSTMDSLLLALDEKEIAYMQQQGALNDSIRKRMALYESGLMALQPVAALTSNSRPLPESSFNTNVFFRINSYEVPSQSFNELLDLVSYLKSNPGFKLQLTGYADQTGHPYNNLVLSRRRVEVIAAFFQRQGIEKERIFVQYFGGVKSDSRSNPLNRKVTLKTTN